MYGSQSVNLNLQLLCFLRIDLIDCIMFHLIYFLHHPSLIYAQRVRLFVRYCGQGSRVQTTLDPSAETFLSVQCASPGRGGELVGVCGVCARCVGWRKKQ